MRVTIDFDRCEGHGRCAEAAPGVFWIDDQGYTQFTAEPDESEREGVVQALGDCPMGAIRVHESGPAPAEPS